MKIRFLSQIHKILALVIALQLIIWIVSGLVFSFIDHKAVDGDYLYKNGVAHDGDLSDSVIDFSQLAKDYPQATEIKQFQLGDRFAIELILTAKRKMPESKILESKILDSQTLQPITIDQALISELSQSGYQGGGERQAIVLETEQSDENRDFRLPVWKLVYEDKDHSHLYFSATSGEYLGARTDSWRLFDFFIMLHFMDYFERDNFNHPLVIIAALILLFFTTSGLLLLKQGFSKQGFASLFQQWRQKNKIRVNIIDSDGQPLEILADKNRRLFDLLQEQQIPIETICGGGGICGRCKVKLPLLARQQVLAKMDIPADKHKRISDEEYRQGVRLSCQTYLTQDSQVILPKN